MKARTIIGVILGIVGILFALILPMFGGIIGGIIAAVFGAAALLLGLSARKSGQKSASFVVGLICIILAVAMTFGTVQTFDKMKSQVAGNPDTPLLGKYLDNPYLGFVGVILNISEEDKGNVDDITDELLREFNLLNGKENAETTTSVETSD